MNGAASPAIQIERPVIVTEDGRSFDGYLARPTNGRGPGLVIFSEMWGVAPSKTEMAEDYAERGWCAYAPNMFWRSRFTGVVPFEEADRAWQRLNAFDWQHAADDARVAVRWVRTQALQQRQSCGDRLLHGRAQRVPGSRTRRRRCQHLALRARHR